MPAIIPKIAIASIALSSNHCFGIRIRFHRYNRINPASTIRNGAGSVMARMPAPSIDPKSANNTSGRNGFVLASDDLLFAMLKMLIAMVGNRVIRIALRTSIIVASIGVATIGKPRPRVPWIRPANNITAIIAMTIGTSNWNKEINGA